MPGFRDRVQKSVGDYRRREEEVSRCRGLRRTESAEEPDRRCRRHCEDPRGRHCRPCLAGQPRLGRREVRIRVRCFSRVSRNSKIVFFSLLFLILAPKLNFFINYCNIIIVFYGSEFSEIFDVEHFKKTLESDVRVVSAIPATHFSGRHKIESKIPRDVTPKWIHSRFFNQV